MLDSCVSLCEHSRSVQPTRPRIARRRRIDTDVCGRVATESEVPVRGIYERTNAGRTYPGHLRSLQENKDAVGYVQSLRTGVSPCLLPYPVRRNP